MASPKACPPTAPLVLTSTVIYRSPTHTSSGGVAAAMVEYSHTGRTGEQGILHGFNLRPLQISLTHRQWRRGCNYGRVQPHRENRGTRYPAWFHPIPCDEKETEVVCPPELICSSQRERRASDLRVWYRSAPSLSPCGTGAESSSDDSLVPTAAVPTRWSLAGPD